MGLVILTKNFLYWTKGVVVAGHLVRTKNNKWKLFWVILLILTILGFLYQSIELLDEYLQYQKTTVIRVCHHNRFRINMTILQIYTLPSIPFPAVTICNLNPFKKSGLDASVELTTLIDAYDHVLTMKKNHSRNVSKPINSKIRKKRQACSSYSASVPSTAPADAEFTSYSYDYCGISGSITIHDGCIPIVFSGMDSNVLGDNLEVMAKVLYGCFYEQICTSGCPYNDPYDAYFQLQSCASNILSVTYPLTAGTPDILMALSTGYASQCSTDKNSCFLGYYKKPADDGLYFYEECGSETTVGVQCDGQWVNITETGSCTNIGNSLALELIQALDDNSCGTACVNTCPFDDDVCPHETSSSDLCSYYCPTTSTTSTVITTTTMGTTTSTITTNPTTDMTTTHTSTTESTMETTTVNTEETTSTSTSTSKTTEEPSSTTFFQKTTNEPSSTTTIPTVSQSSTLTILPSTTNSMPSTTVEEEQITTSTISKTTELTSTIPTETSSTSTVTDLSSTKETSDSFMSTISETSVQLTTFPNTKTSKSSSTTEELPLDFTTTEGINNPSTVDTTFSSSIPTTFTILQTTLSSTPSTVPSPIPTMSTNSQTTFKLTTSTVSPTTSRNLTTTFNFTNVTENTSPTFMSTKSSEKYYVNTTLFFDESTVFSTKSTSNTGNINSTSSAITKTPELILTSTTKRLDTEYSTVTTNTTKNSFYTTTTDDISNTTLPMQPQNNTRTSEINEFPHTDTTAIVTFSTTKSSTINDKQTSASFIDDTSSITVSFTAKDVPTHSSLPNESTVNSRNTPNYEKRSTTSDIDITHTAIGSIPSNITTFSPPQNTNYVTNSLTTNNLPNSPTASSLSSTKTAFIDTQQTTSSNNIYSTTSVLSTNNKSTTIIDKTTINIESSTKLIDGDSLGNNTTDNTSKNPTLSTDNYQVTSTTSNINEKHDNTSSINDLYNFNPNNTTPTIEANAKEALISIAATMTDEEKEKLGYKLNDLIRKCVINGNPCDLNNDFNQIFDVDYGFCYTFNYKYPNVTYNTTKVGTDYGLRMEIVSDFDEYLSTTSEQGVKVVLHSQNVHPFPNADGFKSSVRKNMDLRINYGVMNRLSSPYGDCNTLEQLKKYNQPFYFNGTYSVEGCYRSCFQKKLTNYCECADPRFPPSDPTNTFCTYKNAEKHKCYKEYIQVFGDYYNVTDCKCFIPCHETIYQASVFYANYYSSGIISKSSDATKINQTNNDKVYDKNSVFLDVSYSRLTYQMLEEVPVSSAWDLFYNLSSNTGLWIGFSAVTLTEIILIILQIFIWIVSSKAEIPEVPSCRYLNITENMRSGNMKEKKNNIYASEISNLENTDTNLFYLLPPKNFDNELIKKTKFEDQIYPDIPGYSSFESIKLSKSKVHYDGELLILQHFKK